jgi:hypothetical protein
MRTGLRAIPQSQEHTPDTRRRERSCRLRFDHVGAAGGEFGFDHVAGEPAVTARGAPAGDLSSVCGRFEGVDVEAE